MNDTDINTVDTNVTTNENKQLKVQCRDYELDMNCTVCDTSIAAFIKFVLPSCDHPIHYSCLLKCVHCQLCKRKLQFSEVDRPTYIN